jgi:hypothetical protein
VVEETNIAHESFQGVPRYHTLQKLLEREHMRLTNLFLGFKEIMSLDLGLINIVRSAMQHC